MSPEQYDYENENADTFHDYEEDAMQDDDYYLDDSLEEGEYDTREDSDWNSGYKD